MSDLIRREDAIAAATSCPDSHWGPWIAERLRALPAVQPVTAPDYCYDKAWDYTLPWDERDALIDHVDLTQPVPIYTLCSGPTIWAVNIPIYTDGDGEADDFELTWFDSEDAAHAALKGETP